MNQLYKDWHIVATVELNAPAAKVWELVGGFYILPQWHPDIALSEVPENQTDEKEIRRKLTFPGQPPTIEQLVFMDNENYQYKYKWYAGPWGERVQKYNATIRVLEMGNGDTCMVQWSSTFWYFEDALTQFYVNGFNRLLEIFGAPKHKSSTKLQKTDTWEVS